MRVIVDLDRCESHGQCVIAAPAVFLGFDDESTLEYTPDPDGSQRAAAEQAALVCPVSAITIEEGS
jgi:ferredoxin